MIKHCIKYLPLLLIVLVVFSSCKSSKKISKTKQQEIEETIKKEEQNRFISSRVEMTIPTKSGVVTLNGNLKLLSKERLQLSLLMPILHSEIARLDVTPAEFLLVDRMGKRFCRITRDQLGSQLSANFGFEQLEKMVRGAAEGGKSSLSGTELGLKGFEKASIALSDFSYDEFTIIPTELNNKYTEITFAELLKMLTGKAVNI